MFDFEKLTVNQKIEKTNKEILNFLFSNQVIDPYIKDQLKRSVVGVYLNLAGGTGRMTGPDKRHFFIMARGSVFESVALLKLIYDQKWISEEMFKGLYEDYESISKMLLGMIRSAK